MARLYLPTLLAALWASGCGDLKDEAKKLSGDGLAVAIAREAGQPTASGTAAMCLDDCDNGVWKYLMADEVNLPEFSAAEGCSIGTSAAFPRDPNIELLTSVNCSGSSKLFLWSVNTSGEVVQRPSEIAQCGVGYFFSNLRRQAGSSGVLTAWRCADKDWRNATVRARFENNAGTEIYKSNVYSSSYYYGFEVGYDKNTDVWAVAFGGWLYRLTRFGISSGITRWRQSNEPVSVVARHGLFQIIQGSYSSSSGPTYTDVCTRVSPSGALLCDSKFTYSGIDTAAPVEGSPYVLMQDGGELLAGTDSAGYCTVSSVAKITARHNRSLNLIKATAVEGTNYAVSLGTESGFLTMSVFQLAPSFLHLTSLPLGSSSANAGLFKLGERIYATWTENGRARIVSIPKPTPSN